jgi:hypothetical protein
MSKIDTTNLNQELLNAGLPIEAGFTALRGMAMAPGAPDAQVREMRWSFFAGAQFLFAAMMGTLDPHNEPTEQDLARLEQIAAELERFESELIQFMPTAGNG